ncbi:hypothetical protein [Tautonia marina]|uniref:hypothetical protein n=1 Tax=Tautonia marina TaxID=2653855 RepID=UPI0012610875|nr:hypothetical protein [Tautonia marina]
MMRLASSLIVAVAMLVSLTSTAFAQVRMTYGYPTVSRGAQVIVRQPVAAQPTAVAGIPYGGVVSPYATDPAYAYPTIAPYTTGTPYYTSGYGYGYVAPDAGVMVTRGYPRYPLNYSYGYGPGYRVGNPYAPRMISPYAGGVRSFGRGFRGRR